MDDARTTRSHGQAPLAQEFKALLGDAEELLRRASQGGDEGLINARARLEKSLGSARRALDSREHALLDRARHAGRAADLFMHHHPWGIISVAAVLGLMAGIVLADKSARDWINPGE